MVSLPDAPAVESMTGEILELEGVTSTVPVTDIPPEYMPRLLDAFRPAVVHDYPGQWDESQTIGRLIIKTRDGRSIRVTFPFSGKTPLCFNVDGIRCMRGGEYEPIRYIIIDGNRYGYSAECLVLANVIREVHREHVTGKRSESLDQYLEDLERSAGKRPPRQ